MTDALCAGAGVNWRGTHWTGVMMAQATGISVSSVQRIWRSPAYSRIGHVSSNCRTDPQFAAKQREIVG